MRSLPAPACIFILLSQMMCGCRESQQELIAERLEPVGGVVAGDKGLPNGAVRIVLRGSQVSDVELQHLAGLEDLKYLYLDNSLVTDAGMKDIRQLPAVQLLSIRNTQISDASVESISNMRSLRWLYVSDTKLSKRGIRKLRKALPNTRIVD